MCVCSSSTLAKAARSPEAYRRGHKMTRSHYAVHYAVHFTRGGLPEAIRRGGMLRRDLISLRPHSRGFRGTRDKPPPNTHRHTPTHTHAHTRTHTHPHILVSPFAAVFPFRKALLERPSFPFHFLSYLEQRQNFEMTFIGNSRVTSNILSLPSPLSPARQGNGALRRRLRSES